MTSVLDLLFDEPATARSSLAGRFEASDVLSNLLRVGGLSLPNADVAGALVELLDQPVGNLVLHGWGTHRSIRKARAATAADPGSREIVRLFEHVVTSTQEPTITADVRGAEIEVARMTLEVEVRLSAANLVVEGGEISQVKTGSSQGKASLKVGKIVLAERSETALSDSALSDVTPSDGIAGPDDLDVRSTVELRTVDRIDPKATIELPSEALPPPPVTSGGRMPPPPRRD